MLQWDVSEIVSICHALSARLELIIPLVLEVIQDRQLRLLFDDADIRQKCKLWLQATNMPVLSVPRFKNPGVTDEDSSAVPNTTTSALSIGDSTASHGMSNNHGLVENKPAGSTQAQEKISPAKGGVALDERPGNAVVQNKVGSSLNGKTTTSNGASNGTSNGASNGASNGTSNGACNDTSIKLGIRQKAMAYVTGSIADVSPEDLKLALEICPDLGNALLNRMLKGETIDPPPSTTHTPVRQNTTSALPFTQGGGDSQTTTRDTDQKKNDGQTATQSKVVWPHMRGRQN